MADVYGFNEAKSKIAVVDKATQDAKDASQDTAIAEKQDKLPSGTEGYVWTAGSDGNGSWQEPAGGEISVGVCELASLTKCYISLDSVKLAFTTHDSTSGTTDKLTPTAINGDTKLRINPSTGKAFLISQPDITVTETESSYTVSTKYPRPVIDDDTLASYIESHFSFVGKGRLTIYVYVTLYYSGSYWNCKHLGSIVIEATFDGNTVTIDSNPFTDSSTTTVYMTGSTGNRTVYPRLVFRKVVVQSN